MRFTYDSYLSLLQLIRDHGYEMASFDEVHMYSKCVILRHDIDYSFAKAVEMAKIEAEHGIRSIYFVLISCPFYNAFSERIRRSFKEIIDDGHQIGLHFDECNYPDMIGKTDRVKEMIIKEAEILSDVINVPVKMVSMHRPSREILESDLKIEGMVNTYAKFFFTDFKYLSDSRRRWREPVETIIESGEYPRIQLLVHPFWYDKTEKTIESTVKYFVNHANAERYLDLDHNITDLKDIMSEDEIV